MQTAEMTVVDFGFTSNHFELSSQELFTILHTSFKKATKKAVVFLAIANNPYITTDKLRSIANCSNIPDMVASINKTLERYSLKIERFLSPYCKYNEVFHSWFLTRNTIANLFS